MGRIISLVCESIGVVLCALAAYFTREANPTFAGIIGGFGVILLSWIVIDIVYSPDAKLKDVFNMQHPIFHKNWPIIILFGSAAIFLSGFVVINFYLSFIGVIALALGFFVSTIAIAINNTENEFKHRH